MDWGGLGDPLLAANEVVRAADVFPIILEDEVFQTEQPLVAAHHLLPLHPLHPLVDRLHMQCQMTQNRAVRPCGTRGFASARQARERRLPTSEVTVPLGSRETMCGESVSEQCSTVGTIKICKMAHFISNKESNYRTIGLTFDIQHDLPRATDPQGVVGGAGVDTPVLPAHLLQQDLLLLAPDPGAARPPPRYRCRGVGFRLTPTPTYVSQTEVVERST